MEEYLFLVVLKDNVESLPFGRRWVVLLGGRRMDQLTSILFYLKLFLGQVTTHECLSASGLSYVLIALGSVLLLTYLSTLNFLYNTTSSIVNVP